MVKADGAGSADPGAGQSQSGNHAGRGNGDPPRCHDLHRPLGLSEPGQQRAVLSLHLPRRPGRWRLHHQRGDEAGRGERHRRAGARDAVRRGGPRLWRRGAASTARTRSSPRPSIRASSCGWRRRWRSAAMDSGVATRPLADIDAYAESLQRFVFRSGFIMRQIFAAARKSPEPRDLCRWRGRARAARRPGGDRGGDRLSHPHRPPGGHRKPPQALRPHHSSGYGLSRSSTRTTIRATATMSQPWSRSPGGAASRRTRPAPWCAPPPR